MATYYIATTGNDTTGDGSSGNPWLTLSKAYTASAASDTIVLKNGTYTWNSYISFNPTTNRTIQGETAGSVIIDGSSTTVSAVALGRAGVTLSISNIVWQNGGIAAATVFDSNGTLTITNCVFKNLYAGGSSNSLFGATSAVVTLSFVNCLFNNIYSTASSSALVGMEGHNASYPKSVTLTNCTIYLITGGASLLDYIFFSQYAVTYFTPTVKNCVIYNGTGGTVNYSNSISNGACTYSCNYLITSPPSGTGNITSDPLFVDAANANFKLRPTSPCIDTGTLS